MPLSGQVLRELREELRDLERRRKLLDTKIQGIELILGNGRVHDPKLDDGRLSERDASFEKRRSLRDAVIDVLRTTTSGATANEVTDLLEEDGFRVGGAETLRTRVAHELSRLRRRKVLRKSHKKRFFLANRSALSGTDGTVEAGGKAEQSAEIPPVTLKDSE